MVSVGVLVMGLTIYSGMRAVPAPELYTMDIMAEAPVSNATLAALRQHVTLADPNPPAWHKSLAAMLYGVLRAQHDSMCTVFPRAVDKNNASKEKADEAKKKSSLEGHVHKPIAHALADVACFHNDPRIACEQKRPDGCIIYTYGTDGTIAGKRICDFLLPLRHRPTLVDGQLLVSPDHVVCELKAKDDDAGQSVAKLASNEWKQQLQAYAHALRFGQAWCVMHAVAHVGPLQGRNASNPPVGGSASNPGLWDKTTFRLLFASKEAASNWQGFQNGLGLRATQIQTLPTPVDEAQLFPQL